MKPVSGDSSRWLPAAAACAVLLAAITCRGTVITSASVAVLGFVLTWWLVQRLTNERLCVTFALASYLLKIVLTAVLYYASFYHWPILSQYQGEPGFWVFGEDAVAQHFLGRHVFYAWTGVAPFPNIEIRNLSFIVYVGFVYFLLGVHPLNVAFLNAWYGTVIIAAGIVMMRRWGVSASSMRLGVALLAFWPSLIFWSTQLMKDPICLTLIMLGLCALVVMTDSRVRSGPALLVLPTGLGVLTFLLVLIRDQTGLVFGLTAMGTAGFLALGAMRNRAWPFLLRSLLSVVMVAAGFAVSKRTDLLQLAQHSPAPPPIARTAQQSSPLRLQEQPMRVEPSAPVQPSEPPPQQPMRVEPSAPVQPPEPPPHAQASGTPSAPMSPTISRTLITHMTPSEPPSTLQDATPLRMTPSEPPSKLQETPPPRTQQGGLRRWIRGMFISPASTRALYAARRGFISSGGYSLIDPDILFDNPLEALAYLPRGLSIALLSPFPRQWFDTGGRTGVFRIGSMVEVLLIYLLVFAFFGRMREARKYLGIRTGVVLVFVALTAIPMSLTVANLGTLFRLRLQFLIPLLLLMCVVDVLGFYRRILARIHSFAGG